jgi:hypothetical protein
LQSDSKVFEALSDNGNDNLKQTLSGQADFILKKPIVIEDRETKLMQSSGSSQKRRGSGRKKRQSASRSSSDAREETILIRHFVTQLIDRACEIVMQD